MTFKEYLISKNIPFDEETNSVIVNDYDLQPYQEEVKNLFPEVIFIWEEDFNYNEDEGNQDKD